MGEFSFFGIGFQLAAMNLGDDVIAERQPETRTFPGRLGDEEGLIKARVSALRSLRSGSYWNR